MSDNTINHKNPFDNQQALDILFNFVEQINKIESIDQACWYLTQHTIQLLGFVDCVVYLVEPETHLLVQSAAYGAKNPKQQQIIDALKLTIGEGIVGNAAKNKQSVIVQDTRKHSDYVVDDQNRLSELSVPIVFNGKLLGVIDSEHPEVDFYSQQHCRYLETLAAILASKIAFQLNIQKLETGYASLQKSKRLSDTFLEISELTYQSSTIEDFYLGLHQIIVKQVNTQSFFVVLFDVERNEYTCPYLHDEQKGGEFDPIIDNKKMKQTLVAEAIQQQQPRIAHLAELQKRKKRGLMVSDGPQIYSWLAVPFQINSILQGAIALQSYDSNIIFNQQDKDFLTFLGQHISTSIEQKLKDQKLQYQALHDTVTELANRSLFLDRLEHAFTRSGRSLQSDLAVLFIDFDDFKFINDNFGHQFGDEVLRTSAQRMQKQLRESDTLARIGGDEFAILLEDLESEKMAVAVAERILDCVRKPIEIGDEQVSISISIGIALKDSRVVKFEDIMRNSDQAMYHAKRKGKNTIQLYEESIHKKVLAERLLLQELRIAIKERQLFFYYQPIVNLESKKIVGFEALLRWQHPIRGLITPEVFIKVAEQQDLIREIDSQLLTSVAKQIKKWQKITTKHFYISINISSQRFVDSKLIQEISDIIEQYQLPKNSIVVELTEHVLIKNIAKARNLFHQIKRLGIKISLDDFGTGYSSLSYIHQLPFDIIKIDRSFIAYINEAQNEHPIVNIIVALAKTMKFEIVAEGIETAKQLEILSQIKCDFGQGYYLSKPLPSDQTDELVLLEQLKLFYPLVDPAETNKI